MPKETEVLKKNTAIAPMQTQRSNHIATHSIEGMRLLDGPGETEAEKAAREAAEAAARLEAEKQAQIKAEAERIAAEKAEADRLAAEKAEADRIEADKKAGKLTDKEYEFLTDTLKHKKAAREAQKALEEATNKLKSFDGIDPAKIKELIESEAKAKEEAEKARREQIEKSGDIEKIKKMMAEDHARQVAEIQKQVEANKTQLDSAQKVIEDLTVGSAFSQSQYIAKELVLTPAIARQVYANHFDVVNGKIVPFDKPRGEAGRTQLVNASGNTLSVDEALKKLVEASPDRDKLVRSTIKPGAGSHTDIHAKGGESAADGLRGIARIQAGLMAGQLKKPSAK